MRTVNSNVDRGVHDHKVVSYAVHPESKTDDAKNGRELHDDGAPRAIIDRALSGLVSVASVLVSVALCAIILIVLAEVTARTFFGAPLVWNMDAVSVGIYIIAFLGGACAYYWDRHLRIRALSDALPERGRPYLRAAAEWLAVLTSILVTIETLQPISIGWNTTMDELRVSQSWTLMPIVVGMVLVGLIALRSLSKLPWRPVAATGVAIAILFVIVALARTLLVSTLTEAGVVLDIAVPLGVIALAVGTPVAFSFMLMSSAYFVIEGDSQLSAVPLAMQNGISNFVLVALPFFFVVAFVMVESGLGARVARVAAKVLGRIRHGAMYSIIVTMFVFSGLSGSKSADIAAVGGPLLDITDEQGYERSEGAALLAASAAMGETIPPSIALLVLGSLTTLSIGALFVAGIVPALLMAAVLGFAVWRLPLPKAAQRGETPATSARGAGRSLAAILPVIIGLIFLVGSIISGVATPSESSAIIAAYMVIIAAFVYRTLTARGLLRALNTTGITAGAILSVVAAAAALSNVLSISSIPPMIAASLKELGDHGQIWFLLLTTVILIVAGSILEGLPALLIFVPLLMPVALQLGINGIQYGIIIIIAMGIGAHTPPLGVGLYTASVVGKVSAGNLGRSVVRLSLIHI